jgi:hypothetical protein
VFPLSDYRSSRHPAEGAAYAILQIRKDAAPVITVSHDEDAAYHDGIKPADARLTFRITGQTKEIGLAPLNSICDRGYVVYWQVS